MSRRHYNLPPLTSLAAFESAARNLSFKNAAQELSVTPGAVSHQIKSLEDELGAALFNRKHRGVELTTHGELLFNTLASAFSNISNSLQSVRNCNAEHITTIGSTSAVSTLYLSRAVIRFWRKHPDMKINQIVQDQISDSASMLDIYLRYGLDSSSSADQTELYRDRLVPVGDENMAARLEGAPLDVLAKERLIYLDSYDKTWTSWPEWFRQQGYTGPVETGLRVNNYAVALEAAREGAGIALGWQRLLFPMLRADKLHTINPHNLPAPHSFYLVTRPLDELSNTSILLKDWIIDETLKITHDLNST